MLARLREEGTRRVTGTDTRFVRAATGAHGFRPDIEGLRAIAIGLVLLYHAGVGFLPGGFVGVDVFFVISGFLITGLLIREVERTGRISLRTFYARRAKRLLPAAAVVLVVAAIGTRVLLPVTQWRDFGGDILAAAVYLVNWRFADRAVDYLAEDVGPSPVLHFWSLAVEEQFYVVWPLLLVAVTLVVRRWHGARLRPTMAIALVLVAVPTFWWSVHLTSTSPSTAFFVTTTRLWELAIGAFVAVGVTLWRRIPALAAAALGWTGLAAVALSAVAFGSASPWPGAGALLPTLGTAAVIVAGTSGLRGPGRLLAIRPMVVVGGLSYSLYLWHWPMLVLAQAWRGELGVRAGLVVVAASFIPAWLSMRFVENPIRFSPTIARSPRLALSVGANLSLVGVVAGMAVLVSVPGSAPEDSDAAGAEVLDDPGVQVEELWEVDEVLQIVPDPLEADQDVPDAYDDGCQVGMEDPDLAVCDYGAEESSATLSVALVGDSKALPWLPALEPIADEHGWRLMTVTKAACTLSAPSGNEDSPAEISCAEWNELAIDALLDEAPDLVLISGGAPYEDPTERRIEALAERWSQRWRDLLDAGIDVVPIADTPYPGFTVFECVAENRENLSECSFDRQRGIEHSGTPVLRRAAELAGVTAFIDLTETVCPGDRCPPVVGNVLVYWQGAHVTRTFAETSAEELAEQLELVIDELAEGD